MAIYICKTSKTTGQNRSAYTTSKKKNSRPEEQISQNVKFDDSSAINYGVERMGNGDDRFILELTANRLLNTFICLNVNRCCDFVKY